MNTTEKTAITATAMTARTTNRESRAMPQKVASGGVEFYSLERPRSWKVSCLRMYSSVGKEPTDSLSSPVLRCGCAHRWHDSARSPDPCRCTPLLDSRDFPADFAWPHWVNVSGNGFARRVFGGSAVIPGGRVGRIRIAGFRGFGRCLSRLESPSLFLLRRVPGTRGRPTDLDRRFPRRRVGKPRTSPS